MSAGLAGARQGVSAMVGACLFLHAAHALAAERFEVLGLSGRAVLLRENLPAGPQDLDACAYPGLDPSRHVGAQVHVLALAGDAAPGRVFRPDLSREPLPLLVPRRSGSACTTPAEAERSWLAIVQRARLAGVEPSARPPAARVLGRSVPAAACQLQSQPGRGAAAGCRQWAGIRIEREALTVAWSVTGVPVAPDMERCARVGTATSVAIRVSGGEFGTPGAPAPGGFVTFSHCRAYDVQPLRYQRFERWGVLLGGFDVHGLDDREAVPFLLVIPPRERE